MVREYEGMVNIFIDESGNLGRKDRFFVIAALVPSRGKRIVNFIRRFAKKQRLVEVKGSRLGFPEKEYLFKELAGGNDSYVSYIVVDKLNIERKKILEDKNLCYNYVASFLLRAILKAVDEDVHIHLDNHTVRVGSINSFCDYIKIKAITEWNFQHEIFIEYVDSKNSKLIQCVDIAANEIWSKYNHGTKHLYGLLPIKHSIQFPAAKFNKNLVSLPVDGQLAENPLQLN